MPNLFGHTYIQYFQKCIVVFPITNILLFMQLIYAKLFADYITTYINKLFQMLHIRGLESLKVCSNPVATLHTCLCTIVYV